MCPGELFEEVAQGGVGQAQHLLPRHAQRGGRGGRRPSSSFLLLHVPPGTGLAFFLKVLTSVVYPFDFDTTQDPDPFHKNTDPDLT